MEHEQPIAVRQIPVEFGGTTGEYFRIWIVNLALTIVTLGIYSAWATVRKKRYFYGQTTLDGGRFDFHADPVAILIGRVIALALLAIYYFAGYLSPLAPVIVMVFIFAIVPWLVVRSRIFRQRNTSYRGVRFNFRPNYRGAFKAFYLGGLVWIFTLGFGAPVAIFWKNEFMVDNSAFGRSFFRLNTDISAFYDIFWKTIGVTMLGFLVYGVYAGFLGAMLPELITSEDADLENEFSPGALLITLPIFVVYTLIFVYSQVRHRNLVWNTTAIEGTQFDSSLSVRDMMVIYLTNAVAIIATLGMATPWAQIRLARYRASKFSVTLEGDWQNFIAAHEEAGSAAGDSIGDAFDIGVDIGI